MGLLDKVKEQAAVAGAAAKDAAAKGQAKMEEAQAKRAADGQLRELGLGNRKHRLDAFELANEVEQRLLVA